MTAGSAHRGRPPRTPKLLCGLCWIGLASSSAAGPWNRPAGDGLVIVDYTLGSGTDYFDGRGRLAPARRYAKGEVAAYVEYGATDSVTLIARPSFDSIRIGPPDAGRYRGLGSGSFGAQWQALVFGPAVLAVQGTFSMPGTASRTNPAVIGNTAREADLRLLGGVSLPVAFRPFLDLQGSYRVRSGGAASQWHGDATFGFYPTDKLLMLVRSVTTVPTGRGDAANPSARSTRLGLTGVYVLTQAWALQLGVSTTAWGREALHDRGFTVGVWRYF